MEHSVAPKTHSFLKAVMGVIVADVQHTTRSEQLNEKMNILGTVCNVLKFVTTRGANVAKGCGCATSPVDVTLSKCGTTFFFPK